MTSWWGSFSRSTAFRATRSAREDVSGVEGAGITDAPNGARDVLDLVVLANAGQLGAYDPVLERKIASDVEATREAEPDKPEPLPALDLLAYYWPPQGLSAGHFVMDELQWGIFLPTGGVEYVARFLVDHEGFALEMALRVAAELLYLHEYFHHLVSASSALMQQRIGDPALYENYHARVYGPRGYFELEEALANAFALRIVADKERDALTRFTRRQPRGYDLAERYLGEVEFRDGSASLLAHLKRAPVADLDLAMRNY